MPLPGYHVEKYRISFVSTGAFRLTEEGPQTMEIVVLDGEHLNKRLATCQYQFVLPPGSISLLNENFVANENNFIDTMFTVPIQKVK
jgi:hypothetical protein